MEGINKQPKKSFDKKVNPFSRVHYGESPSEEDRERTKERINKYLENGWYDTWFSAARRVLTERMPQEKFKAYLDVVEALAKRNGVSSFSHDNITFSTNKEGGQSWYIKIPTEGYLDNQEVKLVALKITDHLTNRLQTESKDGTPIIASYLISEDYKTVSMCPVYLNAEGGHFFLDEGRMMTRKIPIEEFTGPNFDEDKEEVDFDL